MKKLGLIRNADKVKASLKRVGGKTITTQGCKIYIPARYRSKHLATISDEIYIYALFMYVVEDKY